MIRTRSSVLDAAEAVVRTAVEAVGAAFYRNPEADPDASHAGIVIMTDGDPGEPDIVLSPLTYVWEHRVAFEIAASGQYRRRTVEAIIAAFEPAIASDRTLGGTVDDARISDAPDIKEYDAGPGVEKEYVASLIVTLYYDTVSGAG
jgi:hypothetical protein